MKIPESPLVPTELCSTASEQFTSLPKLFRNGGFDCRVIKRQGRWVLLAKRQRHWPAHLETFEVCRIRIYPGRNRFGREFPATEALPPSESWGREGFSYSTEEEAWNRFRRMVQEAHAKCTEPPFAPSGRSTYTQNIKTPSANMRGGLLHEVEEAIKIKA